MKLAKISSSKGTFYILWIISCRKRTFGSYSILSQPNSWKMFYIVSVNKIPLLNLSDVKTIVKSSHLAKTFIIRLTLLKSKLFRSYTVWVRKYCWWSLTELVSSNFTMAFRSVIHIILLGQARNLTIWWLSNFFHLTWFQVHSFMPMGLPWPCVRNQTGTWSAQAFFEYIIYLIFSINPSTFLFRRLSRHII